MLCGGNIDTRLLASVLTRELAREGRLTQLTIDLADRPGTLAKVANLLGEAGANIVEVYSPARVHRPAGQGRAARAS